MPDIFLHGIEITQIDDGIRPIQTVKSSIIGVVGTAPTADATKFPLDTPVLITGPRMAALLGLTGTLLDTYNAAYANGVSAMVVVRVQDSAVAATQTAAVLGSATLGTGIYALLTAANVTGQKPKILAAPGFTSSAAASPASPVVAALLTVAAKLNGIAVVDGPNTNEADAITVIGKYGSDRLYMIDPAVRVYDETSGLFVTKPASGFVAGIISYMDVTKGFWWSPSNQIVNGIGATARPIEFGISNPETEANRLNAAKVATIVRENGYRLWGNRTAASDPLWAFLPVRRTADMVYESIEQALLWAMDRPFSAQLLLDIRDSVQSYLNSLKARGAILGGKVWLDPELNSEANLKAGKLFLDFDIEPPAPLEHLTFRAHREGSYYEELVATVLATQ
jgi:phage tail sheath protein FI